MPLLSKLEFDPWDNEIIGTDIYSKTLSHFAEQLTSIAVGFPVSLNFPQLSRDLISICIPLFDESQYQFPFINTRALQHLGLRNVP
ncbi:hypothetical protein LPJ64_006343, partial [Coemansia asiatica]